MAEIKLNLKVGYENKANFSVTYDKSIFPGKWFSSIFSEMVQAYYFSVTKPYLVKLKRVSEPIQNLIKRYYSINELKADYINIGEASSEKSDKEYSFDPKRVCIAFSSGKDCVHLLKRLIEQGIEPNNILCIYTDRVNKSEAIYEKKAGEIICAQIGCHFKVIKISSGIKFNRDGHNIGLRGQLSGMLSLPYMLEFGSNVLYLGLKRLGHKVPQVWTDDPEANEYLNQRLNEVAGVKIDWRVHTDFYGEGITGVKIMEDMAGKYRSLLDLTSSCYTQINFREKRNATLQAKVPNLPIYNGCGNCRKCVEINAAILIWDKNVQENTPLSEQKKLLIHLNERFDGNFSHETEVKELLDICEQKLDNRS